MKPRKLPNTDKRKLKVTVFSESGNQFKLRAYRHCHDSKKFSLSMWVELNDFSYYLVRFDGFAGPHRNKIERRNKCGVMQVPRNTPHIHQLTERYQLQAAIDPNFAEEEYAVPATEFWDAGSAFEYFKEYCNLVYQDQDPNYPIEFPLFPPKQ